jgi:hypothetical protein
LVITEPSSYRDIGASLFLGMMIVRGQMQPGNSTIDPSITIFYLELDDDDNYIGNGTPHYQEIAAGFGEHNMDAPPLDFLEFDYPNGRPELISPFGGVAFTVQVNDLMEDHAPGTAKLHVDRGNGFETYSMNQISPGLYEANFPTSDCATELKYYFSADTTANNTQANPSNAPETFYTALSADSVSVKFSDNFNTNKGWSVSGNASDGQWTRGVPVGGGDRGDPAADDDGSGSCYLTDNADGNSDVDGGSTVLTSPIFDATTAAGGVAVLKYSRWYSNNVGDNAEADIFVVEISNNGGSSWTNVETVGPTGIEVRGGWFQKTFRIDDFVTPTNQMRVRFTASDLGNGSIVEAGVDAFEVLSVNCAQVIAPDSVTMIAGVIQSGDVSDVDSSDDQRLTHKSVGRNTLITAEYKGVSTTETPSLLNITIESRKGSRVTQAITQTIELYNYDTDAFESVDSRVIGQTDSSVTVELNGDLSKFVEAGTKCLKARTIFFRPLQTTPTPAFGVDIDEFTWLIGG